MMLRYLPQCLVVAALGIAHTNACDDCYGPTDFITHDRVVRRMQPDAQNAAYGPTRELEWGQINFMHTTDTHGWLEGHIKEQNYGADWGDFVSFTRHMKAKAQKLGVDLLLVDTGDLHDGAGLSDASTPNGVYTNPIFENIDYDVLTIGNHELYVSDIAYETFHNFSSYFGDRYVTSNVQIYNRYTGQYEYAGSKYRYFTTEHGMRIMAFGVLFDFKGNSNASIVTPAKEMVKQEWFLDALNSENEIDLFLVIGHNALTGSSATLTTVLDAIRAVHPNKLIQVFGGHSHIRDMTVYDSAAVGLQSGRYCETLGWMAVSGIESDSYFGAELPEGVSNPTRTAAAKTKTSSSSSKISTASASSTNSAINPKLRKREHGRPNRPPGHHEPHTTKTSTSSVLTTSTTVSSVSSTSTSSPYRFARRYLDWNRLTFAFHAENSQNKPFDLSKGLAVTTEISDTREKLNLTNVYGCAPQTWCQSCQPFLAPGNIFSLLTKALAATVINPERADVPRLIITNTGHIRFDLVKGPFTYDDSFIVSPFDDAFQFIRDVPYTIASQVINILNAGAYQKRETNLLDLEYEFPSRDHTEDCRDPHPHSSSQLTKRSTRGIVRRQSTGLVAGYNTTDDFGNDGDDTQHTTTPHYSQPNDFQANASFPVNGSLPITVDLVFLDFIGANYVIPALNGISGGEGFKKADIEEYLPTNFTTNDYLPMYARISPEWQENLSDCPVGKGVGFTKH